MLLIFGMGTVFVFLAVLVVSTSMMSRLINKYFPEPVIEPVAQQARKSVESNTQLISAITAAIHQYRRDKKK